MPLRDGAKARIALELVDAYFRAYDDYQPLKRGEPHCRLDSNDLAQLEPGLVGGLIGGVTFDEWGVDGVRLCVHNAVDAIEHGARVFVHTTVEEIARAPSPDDPYRYVVSGARSACADTRRRFLPPRVVVNATGAWSPITAGLGGLPQAPVRVRPGKGIHVVLDRRITNYGILSEAIDGRQVFLEPWQNVSVLGTTDDDYYGDLDDVRATSEEVRYLVQGVARTLPGVRLARAIGTYAGVRPTLYEYGRNEDSLSQATTSRRRSRRRRRARALLDDRGQARELPIVRAGALRPRGPERLGQRRSVLDAHASALPGGERVPDASGQLGACFGDHSSGGAAARLSARRARSACARTDRAMRE